MAAHLSFSCRCGNKQQRGERSALSPSQPRFPSQGTRRSFTGPSCFLLQKEKSWWLVDRDTVSPDIMCRAPPRMMTAPQFLLSISWFGIWKLPLWRWILSLICICQGSFRHRKVVGLFRAGLLLVLFLGALAGTKEVSLNIPSPIMHSPPLGGQKSLSGHRWQKSQRALLLAEMVQWPSLHNFSPQHGSIISS